MSSQVNCRMCGFAVNAPFCLDDSSTITVKNVLLGRCEKCGAAIVLDGLFQSVFGTIQFISREKFAPEELRRIEQIFRESEPNAIHKEISQESKKISGLSRFLPKDGGELCAYIMAFLMILERLDTKEIPQDNIHKIVMQAIEEVNRSKPPQIELICSTDKDDRLKKNDPCYCNSGLKYKRCHGKEGRAR